jgi:hypothetical protein
MTGELITWNDWLLFHLLFQSGEVAEVVKGILITGFHLSGGKQKIHGNTY